MVLATTTSAVPLPFPLVTTTLSSFVPSSRCLLSNLDSSMDSSEDESMESPRPSPLLVAFGFDPPAEPSTASSNSALSAFSSCAAIVFS